MAHGKVDQNKDACCKDSDTKLVKATELPLNGNPYPPKDQITNETPGMLERNIAQLRMSISPFLAPVGSAYSKTSDILSIGVAHTMNGIDQLSENRSSFIKALIMGCSGMLGVLVARRGFFRRITYGSVFLATSGLACYPNEFKERAQMMAYIAKNKLPGAVGGLGSSLKEKFNLNKSEQSSKEADNK